MKAGSILICRRYTRLMARSNPEVLFVFGDNMARKGYGGQAAALRDEPNAVGIPTKWEPTIEPQAFFKDRDLDISEVADAIAEGFSTLELHLLLGGNIVWPQAGIGTDRARLKEVAPRIWTLIEGKRKDLWGKASKVNYGF